MQAGTVNPRATLWSVDLTSSSKEARPLALGGGDRELYLAAVQWRTQNTVNVLWTLRAQNSSIIAICDAHTGECKDSGVPLSSNIPTLAQLSETFAYGPARPFDSSSTASSSSTITLTDDATETPQITFIKYPRPDSVTGAYFNIAVLGTGVSNRFEHTHCSYTVRRSQQSQR